MDAKKSLNNRMQIPACQRTDLRLKQRRQEERMFRDFDRPH